MELLPGEGVGLLKLGMTLWDTINLLRGSSSRMLGNVTQSAISWSSESPNSSYIVISILFGSSTAYRLIYSGITQRLELIEALPSAISSVTTWKGQPLFPSSSSSSGGNDSSTINPQRALNSKFGPTYPPSPHPSFTDELVLSYPGVVFSFYREAALPSSNKNGLSLSSPSSKQSETKKAIQEVKCPLTRLVVSRHDPSANHATTYPHITKLEQSRIPFAVAEGDVDHVNIELSRLSKQGSKITINLVNLPSSSPIDPVEVILGKTSAEDIACSLGPPLRTYYKEDTRLSIHGRSSSTIPGTSTEIPPDSYFYNYFSLGLDFLFHPENNKVIKVLIHADIPGEVLFGRYNKCRWRIEQSDSSALVTSEDSLDKVKGFFNAEAASSESIKDRASLQRSERTMLLDRLADHGDGVKLDRTTDLIAYPGCIMEVTQNKCIETLWIV